MIGEKGNGGGVERKKNEGICEANCVKNLIPVLIF